MARVLNNENDGSEVFVGDSTLSLSPVSLSTFLHYHYLYLYIITTYITGMK